MSQHQDPRELFRRLQDALVKPEDAPDPTSPEAMRVLAAVHADSRRRRRTRVLAPILAVILIAAGGVAYVANAVRDHAVVCFEDVNLDSSRYGPATSAGINEEACHDAWRSGTLNNPAVDPGTVPPLTSCLGSTGSLWVFPTDDPDACARLGLAALDEDQEPPNNADLEARLAETLSLDNCLTMSDAEAAVEAILTELELDDWVIQSQPPEPDWPCTTSGVDRDAKMVVLIPMPHSSE